MRLRLLGRGRWLVPVCLAILTLGTPGIAAAGSNVPPTVMASVSSSDLSEPQAVVATATFTDPESATETYACTIDYGDGAAVAGVVSGLACAGPAHHYLVTGTYTVTVTVTDSAGASGSGVTSASYVNTAPWVEGLGVVGSHEPGKTGHATAAVVDPGSDFETYQCTSIDYGDGTPLQSGTWVPTGWSDGLPRCVFPDHIYAAAGKYLLTAVVTDGGGAVGSGQALEVIVPQVPPVVVAPADQTADRAEGAHDFDLGSFTDPNGAIAAPWSWSVAWGDGTSDAYTTQSQGAMHARHTYAPGTYRVLVTVHNSASLYGFASFNVTAIDSRLTLVFPENPLVTTEGVPATITATSNDPTATAPFYVHTDFGDGTSQDIQTSGPIVATHTYAASAPTTPGSGYTTYNAIVTARDSLGVVRQGSLQVRVMNLPPVVTAAPDVNFQEGATSLTLASFTDASVGPWQVIVDGIPGHSNDTIQHPGSISIPYSASLGNRTVTVTVVDRGGASASANVRIHVVNDAPVVGPILVPSPLLEGDVFTVSADFTDPGYGTTAGSETYTCTVDFGEGAGPHAGVVTGRTCESMSWNYDVVGTYTVTVTVTDSLHGVGTASTSVDVTNVAPELEPITVDGLGQEGPVTASAYFWDPGYDAETYTCSVDYGDGSGPEAGVLGEFSCSGATHFYSHPGTYTVTMTITDNHGAAGQAIVEIATINDPPSLTNIGVTGPLAEGGAMTVSADFTDPGSGFASNAETYTCTADFGDGTARAAGVVTGTTCTARHTYVKPGSHDITVAVTDSNGATGTIGYGVVVSNVAPIVGTVSASQPVEGQAFTASANFTDPGYGSGAETYTCTVDYGDGSGPQAGAVSGNSCRGSSHTYLVTGTYIVTVAVSDSNGGTSSASKTVSVLNVAPSIVKVTATPAVAKTGTTVTASASFADPGTSERYAATWDWGDGSRTVVNLGSAARSVSGSHVYSKSGFYKVKITVSDGQASGSMEASQVVVYDPGRALSGSGSLTSPAGSCRLSKGCSAAGTAGFSLSVSYAKGATKPTVSLAFSVSGFSFNATGADWMVAAGGTATVQGAGKVNGASGYTFRLVAIDGKPDAMRLQVWSPSGAIVYDSGSVAPLKAGSITVK